VKYYDLFKRGALINLIDILKDPNSFENGLLKENSAIFMTGINLIDINCFDKEESIESNSLLTKEEKEAEFEFTPEEEFKFYQDIIMMERQDAELGIEPFITDIPNITSS